VSLSSCLISMATACNIYVFLYNLCEIIHPDAWREYYVQCDNLCRGFFQYLRDRGFKSIKMMWTLIRWGFKLTKMCSCTEMAITSTISDFIQILYSSPVIYAEHNTRTSIWCGSPWSW
jgi:hypothetical protein